ncbi:transglutaminase family protein [Ramlibacter sp. MAHUQ-53]|uniref:transglutaminase family protein n=1 Tax=unclassified Ramlibacter TaxID=2617605 RepID=UPI00363FE10A
MLNALRARLAALPRDSRDTLFLLLVIAWVLLPQATRLPLWCSALAAGVLAWRGWLAATGAPLPGRLWRAALLALTLAATLWTHRTLLGRDAGVTLVVALLALKTLELRARRDAFVVFFLGFFTLVVNFFFSQSLPTALAMGVALLGLLTALVNAHLPVGRPPLRQSAGIALRLVLFGAPVTLALFLLFPRLPPLWGIPGDALTGRSGLAGDMEVGQVARLALDDGIAMRVRFEGPVPPRPQLYFRGPVLTNFDGRVWRPLYPSPLALPSPAVAARRAPLEVAGEPVRYVVTLEPGSRPWLPVLDATAVPPASAAFAAGPGPLRTPEMQWLMPRPVTDLLRYEVASHLDWRLGPLLRAEALPLEYRELPPGFNPRTLQLATDLMRASTAPPEDKGALVAMALERLRTGGYRYTLEPGTYGQHTADEFWFDKRAGFCEHIASAFVLLMRGMDIPARVVTGYQGGEVNPVDGAWVVRHSDAHAWAEVWLAGRGWVRVDPTAAVAPARTGTLQRLLPPPGVLATAVGALDPGLALVLRNAWEALNNAWNQRVLNYTQGRQLDLLRGLGLDAVDWRDLVRALAGLLAATAAAGALWALLPRGRQDPWLRLLDRARRRLARGGLAFGPAAGPRQMAEAVIARHGPAARAVAEWLLRLEALRYAPRPGLRLSDLRREFRQLPWPS